GVIGSPNGPTDSAGTAVSWDSWSGLSLLLPFIDGQQVLDMSNFQLHNHDVANTSARNTNVAKFVCPSESFSRSAGSNYRLCRGLGFDWTARGGMFFYGGHVTIADIVDGTAQ